MSGVRVLGLTGSVASGKSFVASLFDLLGIPVFDADATVHALLAPGGLAVAPVLAAFPETADAAGGIDRRRLGARVFHEPAALARLERILHPLVREAERRFLARCARHRIWLAVLDIPLLFETGAEARVDRTVVVSCHPLLQEQRALARPGMSRERLARVRAHQWPDAEKVKRADYVIRTGRGRGEALAAVRAIVRDMRDCPTRAFPDRWLLGARRERPRRAA